MSEKSFVQKETLEFRLAKVEETLINADSDARAKSGYIVWVKDGKRSWEAWLLACWIDLRK